MAKGEELSKTSPAEIEKLIEQIRASNLDAPVKEKLERLLRTVIALLDLLQRKNLSIKRLKNLLFGKKTEKLAEMSNRREKESKEKKELVKAEGETTNGERNESEGGKKKGHGRRAAKDYAGAKIVECRHGELKTGEICPHPQCGGHLYHLNEPKMFMQFTGRPLISATNYEQEVLRCAKCQDRFVAPLPEGISEERYDPTCDATVALLKYDADLPWYRQARLLKGGGIPLSESVLWERCEAVADAGLPVFLLLERLSSEGEVFFADDTTVTILEWEKEKKYLGANERKGTYTTGMVVEIGERKISLYASGHKHAGEKINDLLGKRRAGLGVPIQMSDGAFVNWKGDEERICAKCLVHARRKFYEIKDYFPEQCQIALEAIGKVYKIEAQTKGMSAEGRLKYHQTHSGPVMSGLKEWIEKQFADREVEPNSALGAAMNYFKKHYEGLTTFLRVPGAPIDNNPAERALKHFVLFRKNSLFFKNDHGAAVGNIIMSLIESCRINGSDPWAYLVTVRKNAAAVRKNPELFLPWNYAKFAAELRAA
jgi:transposase